MAANSLEVLAEFATFRPSCGGTQRKRRALIAHLNRLQYGGFPVVAISITAYERFLDQLAERIKRECDTTSRTSLLAKFETDVRGKPKTALC
jgi:hypothetical protein